MRHSCAHPLGNQISLELRNRTDDVKQELPGGRRGVHAFGVAYEIDSERAELVETFDQMFQRAGKAIEFPNQNNIEEALSSVSHERVELRPMALNTTHSGVYVLSVRCKALAGEAPKILELDLAVLV